MKCEECHVTIHRGITGMHTYLHRQEINLGDRGEMVTVKAITTCSPGCMVDRLNDLVVRGEDE